MAKIILIKILYLLFVCLMKTNVNANKIYNIVALGTIGVGKTSLLNMLAKGNLTINFNETIYDYLDVKLRLIDTHGLNEDYEKDTQNIESMIRNIQKLERVDLFILCLDGANTRLTDYTTNALNIYMQIFPDFLSHMIIVFNKWNMPDLSQQIRLKNEYQIIMVKKFGARHAVECFFIDSYFDLKMLRDNDDGSQTERFLHANIQSRTSEQLEALLNYLTNKQSVFDVKKIQVNYTNPIVLRQEMTAKLEEQRLEYESQIKDIYNNIIDWDDLGEPTALRLRDTQEFFAHKCETTSKGYVMNGIKWRFKAEFSCPTFTSNVGYAKDYKTRDEALKYAAFEFVKYCIRTKRMKRDQLEAYLKTPIKTRKESKINKDEF